MRNSYKKVRLGLLVMVLLLGSNLLVKGQDLGVNFNESIAGIDTSLLVKSKATWVRGFVHIPRFFLNIDSEGKIIGVRDNDIQNFSDVNPFLDAGKVNIDGEPIKLILSLKLDFKYKSIGVPKMGSPEMTYLLDAIEKFLKSKDIGQKIDVLVLGNEPMWETENSQASDYGAFLNYFANLVAAWKTQNDWDFEIFVGALNRAKELKNNAILTQVIGVIKTNNNVDGIDLHPHCKLINQVEDDLSFIRNTHRITKKIILTEFSLNRMFVDHSNDPIGDWGNTYGYSTSAPMYLWLNILMRDAVLGKPHSPEEMVSFFESRTWYPKNWFTTFYNAFKKYNVTAATYRLQDEMVIPAQYLNSSSAMWVLNALYNGKLMGEAEDGTWNTNPIVYPDWAKIVGLTSSTSTLKKNANNLSIYENRNSKELVISLLNRAIKEIEIYDVSGKIIATKQCKESIVIMDLNKYSLQKGLYIVSVSDSKKAYTKKILIN